MKNLILDDIEAITFSGLYLYPKPCIIKYFLNIKI